jgi:hypothetical protein
VLTFRSKGEKIVAKAHGGPIEIYGVTVAQVDDKVRLRSVDTWFDPLEMFRQIAPSGIVNKTAMNRKVTPEAAMDVDADGKAVATGQTDHHDDHQDEHYDEPKPQQLTTEAQPIAVDTKAPVVPSNDGVKIAEEFNKADVDVKAPEDVIPKHISNSTGEPADAFVPHQGADTDKPAEESNPPQSSEAQPIVDAAAGKGAEAEVEHPQPNFEDAKQQEPPLDPKATTSGAQAETSTYVPKSIYSSAVNGNEEERVKLGQTGDFPDESRTIRDAVDEHLEGSSEQVHPHPKDSEEALQPKPGEAIAVPAQTDETRLTHEEMSSIGTGECPFLMNRE